MEDESLGLLHVPQREATEKLQKEASSENTVRGPDLTLLQKLLPRGVALAVQRNHTPLRQPRTDPRRVLGRHSRFLLSFQRAILHILNKEMTGGREINSTFTGFSGS